MPKVDPWPGVEEAFEFAQQSLQREPGAYLSTLTKSRQARERIAERVKHVVRTKPRGTLVMRGVLPIAVCPSNNELMRMHFGQRSRLTERIYSFLFGMNGCRKGPVTFGRPLVRFVRFTTSDPDRDASWTKLPLDVLTSGRRGGNQSKHRIAVIEDDSNAAIDLQAWWEPGSRTRQLVYLDIWRCDDRY